MCLTAATHCRLQSNAERGQRGCWRAPWKEKRFSSGLKGLLAAYCTSKPIGAEGAVKVLCGHGRERRAVPALMLRRAEVSAQGPQGGVAAEGGEVGAGESAGLVRETREEAGPLGHARLPFPPLRLRLLRVFREALLEGQARRVHGEDGAPVRRRGWGAEEDGLGEAAGPEEGRVQGVLAARGPKD